MHRTIRGFSLVEALVALFILGFGLLAVARLHALLVENSSLAKQRTEATRLAQQTMEQLRAFQRISTSSGLVAYNDIATNTGGAVAGMASNTSYTRSWTVSSSSQPRFAAVTVSVNWTDIRGRAQNVTLDSMIAGLDPQVSGSLVVPPVGSPVKRPRNRALNIPVPAVTIDGGRKSAFTPPGASGYYLVFDNDTGVVKARCTGNIADYDSTACPDNMSAHLISGYIRFSTGGGSPSASSPSSTRMALTATTVRTSNVGVAPADECSNDSQTTALYNNQTVAYTCLIYPHDHDANPATTQVWNGRVRFALIGESIGDEDDDYKICRYTFDYDNDGRLSNEEHPHVYALLRESIGNQNYLVIRGDKACPTDSNVVNPVTHPVNYNTVRQQPSPVPYPAP